LLFRHPLPNPRRENLQERQHNQNANEQQRNEWRDSRPKREASLESLVLHYAKQFPDLFPSVTVKIVRNKLSDHNGPKFHGPWP
jgi:hypothetical protein